MNQQLRASRETLQIYWKQGLQGRRLLDKHTEVIDTALNEYFNAIEGGKDDFALVALGGYGRGELFPCSDIDLMLLHPEGTDQEVITRAAETVFYPLWDAGLEVGHGVRSPEACLKDCHDDFFLKVALLDARLVAGSKKLYTELLDNYPKYHLDGQRQVFLQKMMEERLKRYGRAGMERFQLEPNIKEGRGGFRDIQSILWTSRAVFGMKDLSSLAEAGLLSTREYQDLEEAFESLARIRNQLHYTSGRKNDQLFFEHQLEIAAALGYRDQKGRLGVECFMQEVYRHLQTIAVTTDLFFSHVEERVGRHRSASERQSREPGISLVNRQLQLDQPALLPKKPVLLIHLFSQSSRTGSTIHFRTRQQISANLKLVDDKFRRSRQAGRIFLEILLSERSPKELLISMLETGFLAAYIPEFNNITSLAQHDIYHVFTVDRHLIQTVDELNKLRTEQQPVHELISRPRVLFLAGLLHDIGKGQGGGHAEHGAGLADQIASRLGFSQKERNDLVFLVEHHLYLSHMAQRRDLDDEQFIFQCARLIKTQERLAMLYLLSMADARATGPAAWSKWKGALLQELYLKTIHVLDQTDLTHPDLKQAARWMREQVREQLGNQPTINLQELPDEYLLNFSPAEIASHLALQEGLATRKIILQPRDAGDHWQLLLISRDRTGLLAKICGTVALHNLNVLGANINTWRNGTIVDTLDVRPAFKSDFQDQDWQALERDLALALENRLGIPHRLAAKRRNTKRGAGTASHQLPSKVNMDNQTSDIFTIVEVFAEDRPSLLYNITRTMADFDLNIHRALISTRQEQLIDVFYVLDQNGQKLTNRSLSEEVRQAILHSSTTT